MKKRIHKHLIGLLIALQVAVGCLQFVYTGNATEIAVNKQTISFVLPPLEGKVRTGQYHIRVSAWSTKTVQTQELLSSGLPNFDASSYKQYSEQVKAQANSNGLVSITLGTKTVLPELGKDTYLQVEFRPASTDPKNFILLDAEPQTSGVQRYTSQLQGVSHEYNTGEYIPFSGVLLTHNGLPERTAHMIRFSLWRSADIDFFYDQYSDGTFNLDASNFFQYVVEKEVMPDANGKFSADIGFLMNAAKSFSPRNTYLQVDVRPKDGKSTYQLIDPDSDVYSAVDRFNITNGALQGTSTSPQLAPIGNTGKWLVSQVPAGTTRNSFELGLSNTDPNAMIEIRANQSTGKKGVLRFNGQTKKWEVSSDGEIFSEIATGFSSLLGTPEKTFTIGLGDTAKNAPWKLQFGGTVNGAAITFDPVSNSFIFNRAVDFAQNELKNAVLENRTNAPVNPKAGQQYFNTNDKKAYYYDGSAWVAMSGVVNSTYFYGGGSSTNTVYVPTPGGSSNTTGTPSNIFTFNDDLDNNGNVTLVAGQQSGANGKLRYNGTTKQWETSNDGTLFSAIVDISSPQTLTNKTIDGDQNTITNIDFDSLKTRVKTQVFTAQYAGATSHASGANNKGILESLFDTVGNYTYYAWSTSQPSLQSRDVILSWKLPDDFESFSATPLKMNYRTTSTNVAESFVGIALVSGNGTSVPLSVSSAPTSLVNGWESKELVFAGPVVFSAGETITLKVTLGAMQGQRAEVGTLEMKYNGK